MKNAILAFVRLLTYYVTIGYMTRNDCMSFTIRHILNILQYTLSSRIYSETIKELVIPKQNIFSQDLNLLLLALTSFTKTQILQLVSAV